MCTLRIQVWLFDIGRTNIKLAQKRQPIGNNMDASFFDFAVREYFSLLTRKKATERICCGTISRLVQLETSWFGIHNEAFWWVGSLPINPGQVTPNKRCMRRPFVLSSVPE